MTLLSDHRTHAVPASGLMGAVMGAFWAVACALIVALAAPAAASATVFVVRNITVDRTAADVGAARDLAIADAQAMAANRLVERLTLPQDRAGMAPVDAATANLLVSGFEVQEERLSGQRYIGVMTVAFDANQVRGYLRSQGVTYVEARTRPVLVLALYLDEAGGRLWEDNPWSQAWRTADTASELVPILVPAGDDEDIAAVTPDQAQALAIGPLRRIAARYGAERVIVTAARPQAESDVAAGAGALEPQVAAFGRLIDLAGEGSVETLRPHTGDMLAAVNALSGQLQSAWKERAVVRGASITEVALDVRYADVSGWRAVQAGLGGASLVVSAQLEAMSPGGALMTVRHRGAIEQVAAELSERGVRLSRSAEGALLAEPAVATSSGARPR